MGVIAVPVVPATVAVPVLIVPSSVASRSDMTVVVEPVSTMKENGPFPLIMVDAVGRP